MNPDKVFKINITPLTEAERLTALQLLGKCGLAVQITKDRPAGTTAKFTWWLEYANTLEVKPT